MPMQTLAPAPLAPGDLLRTIAEGTAGTVGAAFLRSLARCLAASFAADVACVTELADPPSRARILACWPGGELLPDGYEYELAGTPCEPIAERGVVSHPAADLRRARRRARAAPARGGAASARGRGRRVAHAAAARRRRGTPADRARPARGRAAAASPRHCARWHRARRCHRTSSRCPTTGCPSRSR